MHLIKLDSVMMFLAATRAQITTLTPQPDTWNSTFAFSTSPLLTTANLSSTQTANIEIATNFERSNWAGSGAGADPFYTSIPSNASSLGLGSIVKVESYTNTSFYSLPPNVALSRILYITRTLRNETVPASAYILWPFMPKQFSNLTSPDPSVNSTRFPVVAFAHGTSGAFAECGPSHIRNLWYSYSAPFELAMSGYVVVAPDYQGLGVNTTANGTHIVHPYIAAPAAADDLFFAVQAAQTAFSDKLSKEFVVMGHSQGGNAAWGAAVRQAREPVEGYLGAIAGSPVTNATGLIAALGDVVPPLLGFLWAEAVRSIAPEFNQSEVLSEEGVARLKLAREVSMCNSGVEQILADSPLGANGTILVEGWSENDVIAKYLADYDIGNQAVAGPMMVLQGTIDQAVPAVFTDASVALTCEASGGKGIHYERFEGVSHVPVLYASQQLWLGFLDERFGSAGVDVDQECVTRNHTAGNGAWPVENYQTEQNWFIEFASQPVYQTA